MKLIFLALGLLAVFAGLLVCLRQLNFSQPPPAVVSSQGPTIERLERLSHLVSSRVSVADVLIGEGDGCHGAWLIRGDALLAVDLTHAQISEKDEAARRATILLPQPGILQPRVDHSRTKTWEVKVNDVYPVARRPGQATRRGHAPSPEPGCPGGRVEGEHRTSQKVR